MFGIEKIKQWLHLQGRDEKPSDLSPTCRKLLDTYFSSDCDYDCQVMAVGIYPDSRLVEVVLNVTVDYERLAAHGGSYVDFDIKIGFEDVPDASVSYKGWAFPRNELYALPSEHGVVTLLSIGKIEIAGTSAYKPGAANSHIHILQLQAEELLILLPFRELTFEEAHDLTLHSHPDSLH